MPTGKPASSKKSGLKENNRKTVEIHTEQAG